MAGTVIRCRQCGRAFPADRTAERAVHEKTHDDVVQRRLAPSESSQPAQAAREEEAKQ